MNNILIFSDLHINQTSLAECKDVLEEILYIANQNQVDTVIDLGDTFDQLKPSSMELDLFSDFIKKLNRKLIIIAAKSHESETPENTILNHFGILNDTVSVVKEFKDGDTLYCGHFSIKESLRNYDAKLSKKDLKYKYVFLGHIHLYQMINPNICHPGSVRFVNFDESEHGQKKIILITNYGKEDEKMGYLKLKSPIPMIQLELSKDSQKPATNDPSTIKTGQPVQPEGKTAPINEVIVSFCQKLDKIDPKTKVKVKIHDFESFRAFLSFVPKYINRFSLFKYETDFELISVNTQKREETEINNFKESFANWIKNQKIDPKIVEILQKEIE